PPRLRGREARPRNLHGAATGRHGHPGGVAAGAGGLPRPGHRRPPRHGRRHRPGQLRRAAAAAFGADPGRPGRGPRLEDVPVTLYRVTHRTTYRYEEKVSASYGQMHLLPRTADGQTCRTTRVAIDPAPDDLRERVDFFGNRAAFFAIHSEHTSLTVTTTSDLSVNREGVGLLGGQPWEQVRDRTASPTIEDGWEPTDFLIDSPLVAASPALVDYAGESFTPGRPVLEALLDLAQRIHADFEYEPGSTSVTTTVGDVLAARKGVCQDFAHLTIGCLRSLGLAARYVSGYLETEPPAGQERLQGTDVSHAWAALW